MENKLWKKDYELNKEIEKFTVGNDYLLDYKIVEFDCLGSIAHAKMLEKIGVLNSKEVHEVVKGLKTIMKLHSQGKFKITLENEDCHTAIENYLGTVGKKIHTCRSRNDQVLTALYLYEKDELFKTKELVVNFKKALEKTIEKYGTINMPGYTHMQKAMPTTIEVWLGSFISACKDDIELINSVLKLINKSPLGSAAGFGVPVFKIDKEMTAKELGFAKVMDNPLYSQMSRGKYTSIILNLLSQVMFDLNKLATDLLLFSTQEFGYLSLPKELCTGSSIMPQKNNPDVLELVKGQYHVVLGEEFKVKSLISNSISGYNREIQLTKEPLFNSIDITKKCLKIMTLVVNKLKVNKENCKKAMTKELYATENAYKLVKKGIPFREAYKEINKKL
ncbi:MAG: argininosuccinate lyase [archaeon]